MSSFARLERERLDRLYFDLSAGLRQSPIKIVLTGQELKYDRIIPLRKFRGPLNLGFVKKRMSPEKSKWFDQVEFEIRDFFLIKDEITNFVDNTKSILDIRSAVSAEFYPIDLEVVYRFLDGVREAGFLSFSERQR